MLIACWLLVKHFCVLSVLLKSSNIILTTAVMLTIKEYLLSTAY